MRLNLSTTEGTKVEIYDAETKKLLHTADSIGKAHKYFGIYSKLNSLVRKIYSGKVFEYNGKKYILKEKS